MSSTRKQSGQSWICRICCWFHAVARRKFPEPNKCPCQCSAPLDSSPNRHIRRPLAVHWHRNRTICIARMCFWWEHYTISNHHAANAPWYASSWVHCIHRRTPSIFWPVPMGRRTAHRAVQSDRPTICRMFPSPKLCAHHSTSSCHGSQQYSDDPRIWSEKFNIDLSTHFECENQNKY